MVGKAKRAMRSRHPALARRRQGQTCLVVFVLEFDVELLHGIENEPEGLDDVVDGYPRLILRPEGTVWNSSTAGHADYQRYESAIVDFVLRKSASPPTICPTEFVRQQAR